MHIRAAEPSEADLLSRLAIRAKAHWGYSDEFMKACEDELTYTPEELDMGGFEVLEDDGEVRGFYALAKISPTALELDALFVDPACIGRGYGRALMSHALDRARRTEHIERLVIQADPNAADFYQRAGGHLIGERASDSIAGRMLPLYEIDFSER
jgi:N-acetylglutamate synthase-like GNAT family acetyltransferase